VAKNSKPQLREILTLSWCVWCSRQQTRDKLLSHPFISARIFSNPHLEATAGLQIQII